ncbi:MAG: aminopeptidase P N-terminal domain-containing protein [Myxococcota bacterium]
MYEQRREALAKLVGTGVVLVPSAKTHLRNNDVEFPFRQCSDFYYLTGFDEPEALLVLEVSAGVGQSTLFLRERDPLREQWDGSRLGVDGAIDRLGVDKAFPIGELERRLPALCEGRESVCFPIGVDSDLDSLVIRTLSSLRRRGRQGSLAPAYLRDLSAIVAEMRLIKDPSEVQTMRQAARITGLAHLAAMKIARPGAYEYELEAAMLQVFRANGCERVAYDCIVGAGANATVLHYRRNNCRLDEDDLVLIDAGCEYQYYASDVTRTFPASGRFSGPQKAIYEVVLEAQKAAVEAAVPGATLGEVHEVAVRRLTEGLIDLKLLEGSVDDAIESERYKQFYMHRTSHWLGMDVHDVGAYHRSGAERTLEPGMVITVEPGLYVSDSEQSDARFRGVGVRIEDDILVLDDGNENLTADIPKECSDIQYAMSG